MHILPKKKTYVAITALFITLIFKILCSVLQTYFYPSRFFIFRHVRTNNWILFGGIRVNRAEHKWTPHFFPELEPIISSFTHLQWTTMGPASGGLQAFTRRKKARMGVGYSGTPWSGQAMNWNCLTSLFSLEPFCRRAEVGGIRPVDINWLLFEFSCREAFLLAWKRSCCFLERSCTVEIWKAQVGPNLCLFSHTLWNYPALLHAINFVSFL